MTFATVFRKALRHPRALGLSVVCWALLSSNAAHALYKVIGPDGKVSYSDRPPAEAGSKDKVVPMATQASPTAVPLANLPAELREVAGRYPVVLYTLTAPCVPCDQGRDLLRKRGIPFTERLVSSNADSAALEQITGGRETPVMTIGTQVNRGFAPDVWRQSLDAAGYPKESRLPANYEPAAPTPLTPPKVAPPPGGSQTAPAAPPAPPPPASGIRF